VLERPVLRGDVALQPVAFSRRWGAIDQVRRESILRRGATPAARRALLADAIAAARGSVHAAWEALGADGLRRIEALTGLELARGAHRLTAHLALRLERLAPDGLP
jgi:hypothetical protein